ncbi:MULTISPECIES: hypothetical protein [unclassified Brevundimonas]|uniref:hypothetical protein n=1 Tax=unclassified Brevundimonas TaxID=2622653 RepID=UPI0025C08CA2|nr:MULTISPECIES: hypothetical protein [unclassified Brevundimonas]
MSGFGSGSKVRIWRFSDTGFTANPDSTRSLAMSAFGQPCALAELDTRHHLRVRVETLSADQRESTMPVPGQITFIGHDFYKGGPAPRLSFGSMTPQPLGYDELFATKAGRPVDIPVEWRDATVLETNVEDLDTSLPYRVRGRLQSEFTSGAIGLVKGGWLPSFLASLAPDTVILLDRNIVTDIIGRFDRGGLKGREPDFIDLFADYEVRLNPMPFILEGNQKRRPSAVEIRDQLQRVKLALAYALPKARLMIAPNVETGAVRMLDEAAPWFEAHQAFLLRVAPRLTSTVGAGRRDRVWRDCLADADACGVKRTSMILMAVLSALEDSRGNGPARSILKFKTGYVDTDAYNALCDFRAMEMLLNLAVHFPDKPAQFCTKDRGLALFWAGLGLKGSYSTGEGIVSDFNFHPAVLANWGVAKWQEVSR